MLLDPFGPTWTHLDPFRPIWTHLGPCGPIQSLDPLGQKGNQVNILKIDQHFENGSKSARQYASMIVDSIYKIRVFNPGLFSVYSVSRKETTFIVFAYRWCQWCTIPAEPHKLARTPKGLEDIRQLTPNWLFPSTKSPHKATYRATHEATYRATNSQLVFVCLPFPPPKSIKVPNCWISKYLWNFCS